MNKTIQSCFQVYPIFCAVATALKADRWPFQQDDIGIMEPGSGTISSSFFVKTDDDGMCMVGGGAEIRLETFPDRKRKKDDMMYATFYFPHKGLQAARVDVNLNLSSGEWSLLHSRNPGIGEYDDPTRPLMEKLGITTPEDRCELSDIHFALDIISRLSDLAYEHAND